MLPRIQPEKLRSYFERHAVSARSAGPALRAIRRTAGACCPEDVALVVQNQIATRKCSVGSVEGPENRLLVPVLAIGNGKLEDRSRVGFTISGVRTKILVIRPKTNPRRIPGPFVPFPKAERFFFFQRPIWLKGTNQREKHPKPI